MLNHLKWQKTVGSFKNLTCPRENSAAGQSWKPFFLLTRSVAVPMTLAVLHASVVSKILQFDRQIWNNNLILTKLFDIHHRTAQYLHLVILTHFLVILQVFKYGKSPWVWKANKVYLKDSKPPHTKTRVKVFTQVIVYIQILKGFSWIIFNPF